LLIDLFELSEFILQKVCDFPFGCGPPSSADFHAPTFREPVR
jgi:hypothetical protein